MASIKLKLKTSQVLKNGSHPIIIQLLKDGKKSIYTLPVSCFLSEWNNQTNLPKNRRLALICQKKMVELQELLYEGIDKNWDAKKIINIFSGKETKELMFFKYYSTIHFQNKSLSTIMLYEARLKKFKQFLGKEDISFNDISYELLKNYKTHLENQGMKSVNKYISVLNQIYKYAIEEDQFIPNKNPFKSRLFIKNTDHSTINKNLNLEQTKLMFTIKYQSQWQRFYRELSIDYWRFCFLMRGINIVEMAMLRPEDIKSGYMIFTRKKLQLRTNKKQKIKIFPEARAIIDKYLKKGNKYIFPILKNDFDINTNVNHYKSYRHMLNRINDNLTRIGKEIGINFNLTSTSARYTFINLAKNNEVPFLYLQELIGHQNKSTTDIYLDIFPQSKIDEYHRKVIDVVLKC